MTMLDIVPYFLAQADPAAAAAKAPTKTLLDYVSDAGSLGYVLVILSFVGLALIIRNLIALRASRLAPPAVAHRLDVMLRENDLAGAQAFCAARENDCFLTRVFGAALARCGRSPFGFLEFRSSLEEAGQTEVDKLHRLNDGIGILAAIGPMLGLLGTVFGMIGAFHTIGSLEGATRSHQLAMFMSMALVNTAQGLIVAIPCTIAFALFKRHIDALAGRAGKVAEELAGHLEQQGTGSDRPAPARPAPRPAAAQRGVGVP